MTHKPTNFREAFDVLSKNAAALRDQSEPNIDELLTRVNASVAAYNVCKDRIAAVEQSLNEALKGAARAEPLQPANDDDDDFVAQLTGRKGPRAVPTQRPAPPPIDDDIPF
jgi:exodeoxyribonuclease VII small subunit